MFLPAKAPDAPGRSRGRHAAQKPVAQRCVFGQPESLLQRMGLPGGPARTAQAFRAQRPGRLKEACPMRS
jgi:hypothetical protein